MDGKSATCPRDRPRSVRTRANYRSYARGCACIGVLGAGGALFRWSGLIPRADARMASLHVFPRRPPRIRPGVAE